MAFFKCCCIERQQSPIKESNVGNSSHFFLHVSASVLLIVFKTSLVLSQALTIINAM